MGDFFEWPRESGIIDRCMQYGLLQGGDDYGCVPDIARRLDTLPLNCEAVSFLRGIIINALESRWYSAMLIGGSAFTRNVLNGYCNLLESTQRSIAGIFEKNGTLWECRSYAEYAKINMRQAGAVAVIEGVITPENYPHLEELCQVARHNGAVHASIVGLFACNDEEFLQANSSSFSVVISREDIEGYLFTSSEVSHDIA